MLVTGLVPLGEVVFFDICTHNPTTAAVSDADSTPTFDVYEEATDTGMLGATNFTKRTSLTGDYRGTFTASSGNGFEIGKWYSIIASATVSAVSAKKNCGSFRVGPADATEGYPKVDVDMFGGTAGTFASGRPNVNTSHWAGTATTLTGGYPAVYVAAITNGAITAATFAANALDAVWSTASRILTAGTNIVLAKGTGVTGFTDISAATVKTQVTDALATDTYAEPTVVPGATSSIKDKLNWIFAMARNKITETSTTQLLRNDGDSGTIGTSTVSDDGVTAVRGKFS